MENLQALIADQIGAGTMTQATLNNVRKKDPTGFSKVDIKPVRLKEELHYQFSYYYSQKVQHENLTPEEAQSAILRLFEETFKQGLLHTQDADYQILISKKFKVSILKKQATRTKVELTHNRKKQYLLEEGTPIPFLVELGVMTPEGKVVAKRYDKFRQINRFLEMIEDVVPHLSQERTLNIVDFGCGKSYLTFALYHYLKEIRGLNLNVIGLDLKEDVIAHCNTLCARFGYEQLRFLVGDIAEYNDLEHVDMVVTLHACDTATDAALEKAVRWGADVILSVPCCQHELFSQVANETLSPMLSHGIIKERFSALATDSVRAHLLDLVGYKTQILEFIDMEHTPKNLLIRAVKSKSTAAEREKLVQSYREFKQFLQIEPYLEKALADRLGLVF
ncbi:class I SAM-dependent methyltransferase [Tumebacillus permanentifrigoris]|uniref:Methyltransferase family protein n=1 Tax=Tumebacillus permanentifrigoris TaxID=378543 RepID=A0A316D745_9BACL|nr:SAM-dependent methyltransferase [Tumebacillus permanentifrigoris]PWK09615.1 methyltransferase family protein [Tumebacillus permanentifrigoris]